tara:strand:+ start:591 stop:809 length:219 start_codon:yes stop_codon:yes gene_type:complete
MIGPQAWENMYSTRFESTDKTYEITRYGKKYVYSLNGVWEMFYTYKEFTEWALTDAICGGEYADEVIELEKV